MKTESADGGDWMAGLAIAGRLPYLEGDIETTEGMSRSCCPTATAMPRWGSPIRASGRPRIRIGVDAADVPGGEVLDAEGKVVDQPPTGRRSGAGKKKGRPWGGLSFPATRRVAQSCAYLRMNSRTSG